MKDRKKKFLEEYPHLTDLMGSKQVQGTVKRKENFLKSKGIKPKMEQPKPTRGIAVDGWCSGNPGPGGYRGVDLETSEILFNINFPYCTNNIAEFCAIGHALMYAKKKMLSSTIYSDSQTAIKWIQNKHCNTTLDKKDSRAMEFIGRIQRWLIEQKHMRPVEKWITNKWGEIPADFGHK
jgi:ribonuclease HI